MKVGYLEVKHAADAKRYLDADKSRRHKRFRFT